MYQPWPARPLVPNVSTRDLTQALYSSQLIAYGFDSFGSCRPSQSYKAALAAGPHPFTLKLSAMARRWRSKGGCTERVGRCTVTVDPLVTCEISVKDERPDFLSISFMTGIGITRFGGQQYGPPVELDIR